MRYIHAVAAVLAGVIFFCTVARGEGPSLVVDPYSAPALSAGDAMTWTEPAQPPPIRERLSADEYAKRRAKVLERRPAITLQEAMKKHAFSLRVMRVEPNTQAEALGIKVGDQLVKLDDDPLVHRADLLNARTREDQVLTFINKAGETKTVTLKKGKIGMDYLPSWNGYISYMKSPGRAEKYDEDFRVATRSFDGDTALTETALFHAQKNGYVGSTLETIMVFVASAEWRFDDSLTYAMFALKDPEAAKSDGLLVAAYRGAVSSFKLELARDLISKYPVLDDGTTDRLDESIKKFRSFASEKLPNPIEQIRGMKRTDLTDKVTALPIQSGDRDWADAAARDIAAKRPITFDVPAAHFNMLPMQPPARDVDLSLKYHFEATDPNQQTAYDNSFSISMVNGVNGAPILRVIINSVGNITMLREGAPDMMAFPKANGKVQDGHLRIALVGHRAEVILDGGRILYGPIMEEPESRILAPVFQVVGIKGQVEEISWASVEPKPSK